MGIGNGRRRSLRLQHRDYTAQGVYFVTVCCQNRLCLLGSVVEGGVRLSPAGEIVRHEWFEAARRRTTVELRVDEVVVMPNHVHGLIRLLADAPNGGDGSHFGSTPAGSLSSIVRAFRAASTRRINLLSGATARCPVWQRNFYERIVRDASELDRIRAYIETNPSRWETDRENFQGRREDV